MQELLQSGRTNVASQTPFPRRPSDSCVARCEATSDSGRVGSLDILILFSFLIFKETGGRVFLRGAGQAADVGLAGGPAALPAAPAAASQWHSALSGKPLSARSSAASGNVPIPRGGFHGTLVKAERFGFAIRFQIRVAVVMQHSF